MNGRLTKALNNARDGPGRRAPAPHRSAACPRALRLFTTRVTGEHPYFTKAERSTSENVERSGLAESWRGAPQLCPSRWLRRHLIVAVQIKDLTAQALQTQACARPKRVSASTGPLASRRRREARPGSSAAAPSWYGALERGVSEDLRWVSGQGNVATESTGGAEAGSSGSLLRMGRRDR